MHLPYSVKIYISVAKRLKRSIDPPGIMVALGLAGSERRNPRYPRPEAGLVSAQAAPRTVRSALIAMVLAMVAILGGTTAAQAQKPTAVEFTYHWETGSDAIVVQQLGHLSDRWALSTVIRNWNAATGINVHAGRCVDFPSQHCVKVAQYTDRSDGAAVGYTTIVSGTEVPATIYLNKAYFSWSNVDSHAVTCHEFGHAVGFEHDERSGCTSQANRETPSQWELTKASRAYQTA